MKTSKELSKKLQEGGCEIESKYLRVFEYLEKDKWELVKTKDFYVTNLHYPAYDIIYDICIKHASSFFDKDVYIRNEKIVKYDEDTVVSEIFLKIRQNKPLEEIEKYIWNNCLFNSKNK